MLMNHVNYLGSQIKQKFLKKKLMQISQEIRKYYSKTMGYKV